MGNIKTNMISEFDARVAILVRGKDNSCVERVHILLFMNLHTEREDGQHAASVLMIQPGFISSINIIDDLSLFLSIFPSVCLCFSLYLYVCVCLFLSSLPLSFCF